MLPLKNRLKSDRDYKRVYKIGSGQGSRFFSGKAVKNQLPDSRYGFVIDLRVSKKATVRNLLKRRMREVIQANLAVLRQGYDIVFRAKPDAAAAELEEIKRDLEYLLRKMNLFR